ncbi:MAG: hypothetical protein N2Z80_07010 [Hydrogenothermaceae bacterium]|nr:hypothetical protein [Hydrogenothermaceae bacterium]
MDGYSRVFDYHLKHRQETLKAMAKREGISPDKVEIALSGMKLLSKEENRREVERCLDFSRKTKAGLIHSITRRREFKIRTTKSWRVSRGS